MTAKELVDLYVAQHLHSACGEQDYQGIISAVEFYGRQKIQEEQNRCLQATETILPEAIANVFKAIKGFVKE